MKTEPESAVSSAAQQCISVDLPDPLGPHHRGELARRQVEADVVERAYQRRRPCRRSWSGCAPARRCRRRPSVMRQRCPVAQPGGLTVCRWTDASLGELTPGSGGVPHTVVDPDATCPSPNTCSTPGVMLTGMDFQGSLFEAPADGSSAGCSLDALERRPLSRGAWLDVQPRLAARRRRRVRRAGRGRALAGGAPPDVRPPGRRPAARAHLRRRRGAAAPGARRGARARSPRTTCPSWASRS